jgi:cytoskeletal protein RodZ
MTTSRNPQSAARRRYRRRRVSTARLTFRIAALTIVVSLVIGAGIAWQLAQGEDPALGPKAQAAERTTQSSTTATTSSDSTSSSGYTSSPAYSSQSSSSYSSSPAPVTSSTS